MVYLAAELFHVTFMIYLFFF